MKYVIISVLSIGLVLSSCKQVQKSSVTESSVSSELEKQRLQLDSTWNVMFKSDDNKIENLSRLVKELQMIDGSNSQSLLLAEKEIQTIKSHRYDQKTMSVSKNIDLYDSVTNRVIQKIRNETNQNPNAIKYQIVNQLISEIQQADDSILFYRKEYDRTVDSYNSFLKTRKKDLKKSGINVDTMKPYPVFRLVM